MFKTKLRPLLSLFLLIAVFFSEDVQATHLVGGSLNYEYLGENPDGTYRYRIFSVTYTDVNVAGGSNFDAPEDQIPVAIYINDLANPDANKTLLMQFNMPLVDTTRIELAGIPDGCSVGDGVLIDRGDYEFFVDLPLNFDGYWLYYDRCCRNNAVVNLTPQQGVGFSTYIPSPLVQNNSPFFNVDPVPFLCAGDTSSFLNSAVDPDGDLLVFSFIQPYRGFSSAVDPNPGAGGYPNSLPWEVPTVDYNPTFSATDPFGPGGYAFINGATGLTSYMAPNAGQYAVAVEIKEYRNGNLIGVVRRDLQLVVINCPPNPSPDLSNASSGNAGPTEWEIHEGDTLCFPVIFTDEDGDSLSLDAFGEVFDSGLVFPSAAINTPQIGEGTVQADFCWFTDCSQGRTTPYFFGVTATDNGCPPKSASEVYTVEVIPFTGSTDIEGSTTPCESSTETYTTDVFPDGSYVWTVTGGTIVSGAGTNEIEVDWGSSGTGEVSVTSTNFRGCVGDPFDLTVAILPLPVIDAGTDIQICLGDTITIGGAPTGPAGSFFIWGPDQDISSTNDANPQIFPTADIEYDVQVISANSCTARDTISIVVNEAALTVSADAEICEGGSTQLIASGATEYVWTPDLNLSDDSIADPIASPTTTTTYLVNSVDANQCRAETSVTVTVFEVPLSDAGIDSTLCGLGIQLYATPSVGTGIWTVPVDAGLDDVNLANANATVSGEGAYEFIWEENTGNGLCVDRDTVVVNFVEQPVADAGLDDSVCGLTYSLNASPSAGTGLWTVPADIAALDLSDPTTSITSAAHGSYTLTWTEQNGICSDQTTVDIEFLEIPVADPGLPDEICGDTYILNASTSVGTGTWTGSGNVSFMDAANPNTSVTTTNFGVETITWTEDNQGCTDQNSVDITFNEIPVSDAGADDQACGLQYTMQAVPSVGLGTWSAPAGITVTDMNDAQTLITADSYGSFTLTWSELNVTCTDQSTVEITFVEVPTANAGLDDQVCGNSYSLNAVPTLGDGEWTGPGNLSFSDITDPNATVTSTGFGLETITWTEDNQGCADQNTVDITFNEIPVSEAGADDQICGLEYTMQAVPSVGLGTWSAPAGISITDVNSAQSLITSDSYGTFTLTWSETNVDCSDQNTVDITFVETPTADAGVDDQICGDEYILDASLSLGTGEWSGSGNVSFSDITDPDATVTSSVFGVETITWMEDNQGCIGQASIDVTFFEIPDADAGDDIALCGTEIDLSANPSLGTGTWTGPADISFLDINDPNSGSESSLYGSYTLTWTEDSNGCIDSDVVIVDYLEIPVAVAGADEELCINSSVTLGASGGDSYEWSPITDLDQSDVADPVASPTDTISYVVTVSLANGCSANDTMTVNVNPLPIVDAGEDAGYLCSEDSIQLQATPGFVGYQWFPSSGLSNAQIADPFVGPIPDLDQLLEEDYIIFVTDSMGCQNSDTVKITVNPIVPTEAGSDTIICQGEPVLLGASPVSPAGTEFAWFPTVAMNDSTLENPTVNPIVTTTYTVNTSNSICTGEDEITVMVEESPELQMSLDETPSCTGLSVRFYNEGDQSLTYLWDFGDGSTSDEESPSHQYSFNALYVVSLTGTSDMDCVYEITELIDAQDFTNYFELETPNVFTPNGDGVNDVLDINVTGQIQDCMSMEVFNRWGQVMFISSGNNTKWDGRTQAGELVLPGVYFYFVEFNGASFKGTIEVLY